MDARRKVKYVVFKGDEILGIGTAEELAKKLKVKKRTIYYWTSRVNAIRAGNNGKWAERLDFLQRQEWWLNE